MIDPQFTPGPWIADGPPSNIHILEEARPHMRVCFMTSNGNCVHNANLIAAAPDLFEALEQILDDMGADQFCCCPAAKEQALAAMAKARGETLNPGK